MENYVEQSQTEMVAEGFEKSFAATKHFIELEVLLNQQLWY